MRQVSYRKADRIAPHFSKEKALPWFTQRLYLSNFHANAKYVKYAHNSGMTTVKLHKKGRNRLKNAPKSAALVVEIGGSLFYRFSCPHVVASFLSASTAKPPITPLRQR